MYSVCATIESINFLDTFALTMAMSALGMETSIDKFKNSGIKPFYLSFILYISGMCLFLIRLCFFRIF